MFNIALGWAFLISAMASPGGKIMATIFDASVLRTTPAYQQVLFSIFANYWLPAVLIYLVLKGVRSERYLSPTRGVHALFAIPNIILALYAGLRVVTATVPGGGATFVLATIGAIVAVPCWWALLAATIWLGVRSVMSFRGPMLSKEEPKGAALLTAGGIAAMVMLLPPSVFFGWLYVSKSEQISKATDQRRAKAARFEELCKSVQIEVRRIAKDTKSVLFLMINNATYSLLSELDYTELKRNSWEVKPGEGEYIRFLKKPNEKVFVNGRLNVIRMPVAEPESQYEISIRPITGKTDQALGYFVEETTVRDRRSGETLAMFTNVGEIWDGRIRMEGDAKFCPSGFVESEYKHEVASYVLGLMEEQASKRFAARIAKLKDDDKLKSQAK